MNELRKPSAHKFISGKTRKIKNTRSSPANSAILVPRGRRLELIFRDTLFCVLRIKFTPLNQFQFTPRLSHKQNWKSLGKLQHLLNMERVVELRDHSSTTIS